MMGRDPARSQVIFDRKNDPARGADKAFGYRGGPAMEWRREGDSDRPMQGGSVYKNL